MKFNVLFSDNAEIDLQNIEKYLSQFYTGTVKRFFDKLKKQLITLETMPHMYPEYELDPFFRKTVINDYLLFYSVDEIKHQVIIHRIFHSARNISKLIND